MSVWSGVEWSGVEWSGINGVARPEGPVVVVAVVVVVVTDAGMHSHLLGLSARSSIHRTCDLGQ
jgi:hypothetical protein